MAKETSRQRISNKIRVIEVPSEKRYLVEYTVNSSALYRGLGTGRLDEGLRYSRWRKMVTQLRKCQGKKYSAKRGYGNYANAMGMAIKVAALREIRSVRIMIVMMPVKN